MMRRAATALSAFAVLMLAMTAAGHAVDANYPTVAVPNRVIYPGQEISAQALDVVPLRRQLPNPGAFVMAPEEAVGKVARSTLLPGRMMYVTAMREPYLVETGTPARVVFVNGALSIAMIAVVLQSGAVGDIVRVRNMESGVIFNGIVMADGSIRVGSS